MLNRGKTLLELADEIDRVLHKLQNENNAIHHYELLYKQLSFYEPCPNDLNYQVYQKEEIIAPYLLTHWILCSQGIDNYNMLQAISKKIRQKMSA